MAIPVVRTNIYSSLPFYHHQRLLYDGRCNCYDDRQSYRWQYVNIPISPDMVQRCCRTRIGSASPKATEPQAFRSIQARSKHGGEHKWVSQFAIILEERCVQPFPMRPTDYQRTLFAGHHPTLLSAAQRSAPSLPIYHDVPYTPPPVRRVQTTMSFGSRSATGVIMGIRRTLSIQMQP